MSDLPAERVSLSLGSIILDHCLSNFQEKLNEMKQFLNNTELYLHA